MADTKISALTALTGANTASGDVFPIVDVDANQTKKITRDEVKVALGLGTAAYTASTDYATSSQGSTADTAVQPGDDAADLGSGAATDGQVLTADGSGGAAWETVAGGGGDLVDDTTPQLGGDLDINGHSITGSAGTLTTGVKVLDLSATWNDSGVTFTGLKFNVTDTSSNAASLLLDLQLNGASAFQVGKNTVEKRNSTTGQTLNIYNSYTNSSNYERGVFKWNSNSLEIGVEAAGTGTLRTIKMLVGSELFGLILSSGLTTSGNNNFAVTSGKYLQFSDGTDYNRGFTALSGVAGVRVCNGSTGGGTLEFTEMTAPSAPSTNGVRIYAVDNGAGKTQLMALFASGAAQQIAIEP